MADAALPTPTELERRALERTHSAGQPTIRIITRVDYKPLLVLENPAPEVHRAIVKDINMQSVGLIVRHPVSKGETIGIQLPDKRARVSGILSALVRHCTPLRTGDWLLGCAFSRPLTEEEIASFLSAQN